MTIARQNRRAAHGGKAVITLLDADFSLATPQPQSISNGQSLDSTAEGVKKGVLTNVGNLSTIDGDSLLIGPSPAFNVNGAYSRQLGDFVGGVFDLTFVVSATAAECMIGLSDAQSVDFNDVFASWYLRATGRIDFITAGVTQTADIFTTTLGSQETVRIVVKASSVDLYRLEAGKFVFKANVLTTVPDNSYVTIVTGGNRTADIKDMKASI